MSTRRQGATGHDAAPKSAFAETNGNGNGSGRERHAAGGWQSDPPHAADLGGAAGGPRRKRRRQRAQRGKRRRGPQGRAYVEGVSRERIFQELEGLLRQIREEAEESSTWAEAEVSQMARAVTTFTRELEEQSDPLSERVRSEYQRIREKLTQALRGER